MRQRVLSTLFLPGSCLILLMLINPITTAQETQLKYTRKSISYIDAILPIGAGVKLRPEQENYLLKVVQREIEMSRFDYNPLPDNL